MQNPPNNTPENRLEDDNNLNPVEIFLRFTDNLEENYSKNNNNKIHLSKVKEIISQDQVCYFQKYSTSNSNSRHRILIPVNNEEAVELIATLGERKVNHFKQEYFYKVQKCKIISLIRVPVKNTVECSAFFSTFSNNDWKGSASADFQKLYEKIESNEVPVVEIEKDKDKEIWSKYILALKKLVKEKEQVWKVKEVGKPYYQSRLGSGERAAHIEIFIDEEELMKRLESYLLQLFKKEDLEEYDVNPKRAFLEFNKFTLLEDDKLNRLKILGEELFYDLDEEDVVHSLSCSFDLKYGETDDKNDVFEAIKTKFKESYFLDLEIDFDGSINLKQDEVKYLQKFLTDDYKKMLVITEENNTPVKLRFSKQVKDFDTDQISDFLNRKGLNKAMISVDKKENKLKVSVNSYIPKHFFNELNLQFISSTSRFQTLEKINLADFKNLQKVGDEYHLVNATKMDVDLIDRISLQKYRKPIFRRLETYYYFQQQETSSLHFFRDLKSLTDVVGESTVNISKEEVVISAINEESYNKIRKRIKDAYPSVMLSEKKFEIKFKIEFITDSEERRIEIFNKIKNDLRKSLHKDLEFQTLKNNSSLLLTKKFINEEDRDRIKNVLQEISNQYKDSVSFKLSNKLGTTTYNLYKNESLETENEKGIIKNIKSQTFVFLTRNERDSLLRSIDQKGLDSTFRDGLTIGKLLKKDKNKLTFILTQEFDQKLNAKQKDRLELAEIEQGFIKPIFPGELVNLNRMIRAMRKVTEPGSRNGFPINKNLSNFLFDPNEVRASSNDLDIIKKRILENLNEPLLRDQPRQLDAVAKTLASTDLTLIQGPPGTGKTTVIAEIIWQILLENPDAKILITSQTNLAVDNVLERLKGKKLVRPIRIGKNEKFEDEGRVYSFDRITDWTNAKINSDIERYEQDNAVNQWIKSIKENSSKEGKFSKAIEKWYEALETKDNLIKSVFSETYLENINVFAATCSECGSNRFSDVFKSAFQKKSDNAIEPEFDVVIVDEASKATPPELILPLTFGKKIVIIGDHKQLPPMLDEKEFNEALESIGAKDLIDNWTTKDYATSQFEKLFRHSPKNIVASLDTQFRMHEQIMNCISQFYDDQEELENGLICGIKSEMDIPDLSNKASRWHGLDLEPFLKPEYHAIWVNVDTPEIKVGTSFRNDGEIEAINIVLKALKGAAGFDSYFESCKKEEDREVGIITFYMPQMLKIKESIYQGLDRNQMRNFEHHKYDNDYKLPFRINTVDRFQGMERNIVIISTVRSNKRIIENSSGNKYEKNENYPFALGFARELQRINVGFSRAKKLLIVIGNQKHFAHKTEYAKAIQRMQRIDVSQIKNLA